MAVITSPADPRYQKGELRCTLCNRLICIPFVQWWTEPVLNFCTTCCQGLRQGLVADLIQIDAIRQIQELGYSNITLHREDEAELERREKDLQKAREAEIWQAMHPDLKK